MIHADTVWLQMHVPYGLIPQMGGINGIRRQVMALNREQLNMIGTDRTFCDMLAVYRVLRDMTCKNASFREMGRCNTCFLNMVRPDRIRSKMAIRYGIVPDML